MSKRIAWTPVIYHGEDANWTLGLATEEVPGYLEIKHSGTPEDPFYLAKGPTKFGTYEEAKKEADRKNKLELKLTQREAFQVVASSMGRK